MSFWFWLELEVPVQPSALGTRPLPHSQDLHGTNLAMAGGDNQEIRLQGPTSEVQPTPEKPPQGTLWAPDVLRLEDSMVAPSSGELLFSFISKFSPSKILPKKPAIPNTGNTHMIFAADHILLNLSSSWHIQFMSLQRTIHPLPNGTWIQPSVPSTLLKIGHKLWKPNMVLKTQVVLMMPD